MVFVKDQTGKELGLRFETIKEGALILRKRIEDRRDERNWTQYEKGRDNKFIDAVFVDTLKKSKKTKKYSTALTIFFRLLTRFERARGVRTRWYKHGELSRFIEIHEIELSSRRPAVRDVSVLFECFSK